jgi:hypothetical protein
VLFVPMVPMSATGHGLSVSNHEPPARVGFIQPNTARRWACAQCLGAVQVVWSKEENDYIVQCPKGCQPGGFVSAVFAADFAQRDALAAAEVASNYPELAPEKEPLDKKRIAKALWGE